MIDYWSAFTALRKTQFRLFFDQFSSGLWSTSSWYGFERDMSVALNSKAPRTQVYVRELRKDDISVLLNLKDARDGSAFKDRLIRLSMFRAKIPTCYVAVTRAGVPCHMQWVISADTNNRVRRFTHGGLPTIEENEVLLENAFTLERYRRQGIETEMVRHLLQLMGEKGMKRAILFVSDKNLASLKLVSNLGFTPFNLKTSRQRFFMRHFTFRKVSREAIEKKTHQKFDHYHAGDVTPGNKLEL